MKVIPRRLSTGMLAVACLLCFNLPVLAASRPVITSHTPLYNDGALTVTVQWQSETPVIRATLMAGQEQKSVKLDDDNRRIPQGYRGEVVINAPVQRPMGGDTILYSVQLEDEDRQKSEMVQGRFVLPKQAMPGMPGMPGAPADDGWGQIQGGRIQLPQRQQTQPGQLPPVPQTGVTQQPMFGPDPAAQQPGMMMPQQPGYPPPQQPGYVPPQQPGMMMPPPPPPPPPVMPPPPPLPPPPPAM